MSTLTRITGWMEILLHVGKWKNFSYKLLEKQMRIFVVFQSSLFENKL